MNRTAAVALAALAASACGPGPSAPFTDVTFYWRFRTTSGAILGDFSPANPGCGLANVQSIRVTISGPAGTTVQTVPCIAINGVPGGTFTAVPVGPSSWLLEGLRPGGKAFEVSGAGDLFNFPAIYETLDEIPVAPDVTIYWEFDRNTLIDGVVGFVPYDTIVNWPPGTGSRACPESGVDVVVVTDSAGNPLSGSVPCINQSVQGVVVSGFQGPATYVVTGWRNGVANPLFRGQVTVNAVPGAFNFGTAIAAGIQSNLTIDMILADATSGPAGYPTCGLAGVQRFQGWVEDGFGTLIWRNVIDCGPSFMPSIQYGPVDRDDLFIWIDTYDIRFNPAVIPWSICDFGFGHFQDNLFSQRIPLGICSPAPPGPPALRAARR